MNPHLAPLRRLRDLSGHTDRRATLQAKGRLFLQRLAEEIGLPDGSFDVRWNASGRVTLHARRWYLWLCESCVGPRGLILTYRRCASRNDYVGGPNHQVRLEHLNAGRYRHLIEELTCD